MKNSFKYITIICVTALVLVTGCKKFLDQEVPGAYAEQDFYKTDVDSYTGRIGQYTI